MYVFYVLCMCKLLGFFYSKNKHNVLFGMNNVKMKEVHPQLDFSENLKTPPLLDFSYCRGTPAIRTSML